MADIAVLILRVAAGIVIIFHGLYKLQNLQSIDEKWKEKYGFPQGAVLLTGIVQVVSGTAIMAGVFTRFAALILTLNMLTATYVSILKEHEPFLSTPRGKGWDVNFLLIGALIALIFLGDGRWSLASW